MDLDNDLLERLAEAAHDAYVARQKAAGWQYGPVRNNDLKIHPLLVPYADIPEPYKNSNRDIVSHIPASLKSIGYELAPANGNEAHWTPNDKELEQLAIAEHERWIEQRRAQLAAGELEQTPDNTQYLVPYEDLPESVKQIDRDMAAAIPRILELAGMTVRKTT